MFSIVIILESYDFGLMKKMRAGAIEKAKGARKVGVILGTLGRQGNEHVLEVVPFPST